MRNINIYSPYISGLCLRIQEDINYLHENLEIITEEYKKNILLDIERFLLYEIIGEIRISLYDPMQNNRVFMEYCYKLGPLNSSPSNENKGGHVNISNLPESCMFDIFLYFTGTFLHLEQEEKENFLKDCYIDWFNLDFNLKYNKKESRKITDVINFNGSSMRRSLFESYPSPNRQAAGSLIHPSPGESRKAFSTRSGDAVARRRVTRSGKGFEEAVNKAVREEKKLNYVIYNELESAVESITSVLYTHNKSAIRWSLSRGFILDSLSDNDIGDINDTHNTRDPGTAINFVVENREDRVSYIFEDFHHHIGGASTLNSNVAEIRSFIRDLSRALKESDEYVFILSPSDSLPLELVPVFNLIKQESGGGASLLSRYGCNLTDAVMANQYKPLIGMEDRTKRIIQILCQMETNNPILVGEPGVGKTALIEGLANEIVKGRAPPMLIGKEIFSLNLNTLVAGSRYRGDFEERINGLLEEVKSHSGRLIVFIDEIHTLLGAGSAEGSSGAEDVLKPALARGDFPCIGATTHEGYRYLLKDPALARRFQKVEIRSATEEESKEILAGVLSVFESHHGVRIDEEAVITAVRLSKEYMPDQFLPGKAVRILDSASAFVKLDGGDTVYGKDIEEEIRRSML